VTKAHFFDTNGINELKQADAQENENPNYARHI
jgi:hypothetical protein